MIFPLARAAVATGCDGLLVETHPDPDSALSDGPNMLPLADLPRFTRQMQQIREILLSFSNPAMPASASRFTSAKIPQREPSG